MLVVNFSVGFEKLTRTALWESTSLKLCTDSLHFFKEVKALRQVFKSAHHPIMSPDVLEIFSSLNKLSLQATYCWVVSEVWLCVRSNYGLSILDHEIDCLFYALPVLSGPRPRSQSRFCRNSWRRSWQVLSFFPAAGLSSMRIMAHLNRHGKWEGVQRG